MRLNRSKLTLLLALSTTMIQPCFAARKIAQAPLTEAVPVAQPAAQPPTVLISNLAHAIDDFKSSPSDTTWAPVVAFLQSLLNDPQATQADLSKLQTYVPQLSQLGLKVFDAGQARVWSFPQITQSHEIIVEWHEIKAAKPVSGAKSSVKSVTAHTQVINLPDVLIADAKVVNVPSKDQPVVSAVKAGKAAKTIAKQTTSAAKIPGAKFLVLTGNDKTSKTVWWSSFKYTTNGWTPASDLLANVPASLMNSVQGKVGLSGSDLVVTVTPSVNQSTSYGKPDTSTYKLVFHLSGGKYVMEGKPVDESIHSVIFQFIRAEREGRLELAKTWVADPKLASIPKYIGLSSRSGDGQLRLVAMPGPMNGLQRFRLVTFGRDDLIIDVGRVTDPKTKQFQWIIKAIFVAPADPALQKFARNLPTFDAPTFARLTAESANDTNSVANTAINQDPLEEPTPAKKSVASKAASRAAE